MKNHEFLFQLTADIFTKLEASLAHGNNKKK